MENIRFSVITVVFNGEKYIEETIKSVLAQKHKNIQYIVVDGASTDSTCSIINRYIDRIDSFISEKDSGMYDAINKGLALVDGDYVLILNSDDYFVNENVLADIGCQIKSNKWDFFYCNIIRSINLNRRFIKLRKYSFIDVLCSQHCTFVPHPSFFVSSALLKRHSLKYNLTYKYASDFDFILKCLEISSSYTHINIYSTVFREHEESITSSGKIDKERLQILDEWCLYKINWFLRNYLYYKNWLAYKIYN
jgi:glycosyltransferase involved in cell wall biosynthesis